MRNLTEENSASRHKIGSLRKDLLSVKEEKNLLDHQMLQTVTELEEVATYIALLNNICTLLMHSSTYCSSISNDNVIVSIDSFCFHGNLLVQRFE